MSKREKATINRLKAMVFLTDSPKQEFVRSILERYKDYGKLSKNQWKAARKTAFQGDAGSGLYKSSSKAVLARQKSPKTDEQIHGDCVSISVDKYMRQQNNR